MPRVSASHSDSCCQSLRVVRICPFTKALPPGGKFPFGLNQTVLPIGPIVTPEGLVPCCAYGVQRVLAGE